MRSVLLCTADEILAVGLRAALQSSDFTLAGHVADVSAIEPAARQNCPAVLLIDARVSIDELAEIREQLPDTPILLRSDTIAAELAYQALQVGVRGILRKGVSMQTALRAIAEVAAGGLWFEKTLTNAWLTAQRIHLTSRESDLVRCCARGLKNKEIAHELGIAEGTVKVYLSHLFPKLGVKDRFELALWALKNLTQDGRAPAAIRGARIKTLIVPPGEKQAA